MVQQVQTWIRLFRSFVRDRMLQYEVHLHKNVKRDQRLILGSAIVSDEGMNKKV